VKQLAADEAMARYARGDDAAFAEVYTSVAPRLARFLGRRLRDKATVPDLVQETLLRVHRARGTFVHGSGVMPWVLTIARRQLIDAHRGARREEQTDVELLDTLAGPAARPALPTGEDLIAAKQLAARFEEACAEVPEPQLAALRKFRWEGLSAAEAAAALGTTPVGVRLRTHRACRTLRAKLGVGARRGIVAV
jgi:RNA polymerase sigma-70 factor (ECF subfamily)